MTTAMIRDSSDALEALAEEQDAPLTIVPTGAVAAIAKSEVEAQLDAAHKYPRSVSRFLRDATSLATVAKDVAEKCMYLVPRDGKRIDGPSIRLAEICASSWGNLHIGGRVVDIDDEHITAQGVAWDLERNVRYTVEVKRRITNKEGRRFSQDMIVTTGNAAISIALRNAILRAIPRAYVSRIYSEARAVAVGRAETLDATRTEWFGSLAKMGISQERVLARLGKTGLADVGLDDIAILIGIRNAVRAGDVTIEDAFPATAPAPAAPSQDGQRVKPAEAQKTAETVTPPPARKSDPAPGAPAAPPPRKHREPGED
jgi:hypothetical protein